MSIVRYGTETNYTFFSLSGFELAQMTLGQNHDTSLYQRQSLGEVGTSNVSP